MMEKSDVAFAEKTAGDFRSDSQTGENFEVGEVQLADGPKLKKKFNAISVFGVNFSATALPVAVGSSLAYNIGIGGSPVFFYGFLVDAFFSFMICMSLAEIAAVYPNASGQVYWTAVLAPKKHARTLSYFVGGFTLAAWVCSTAGAMSFTAAYLWCFIELFSPDFVATTWQSWLLIVALFIVTGIGNIYAFRYLPKFFDLMIVYINVGTIYIFIGLLARANPKQSAAAVFVDFQNSTGWDSMGLVFFLGLLPGIAGFICMDSASHMSEELPEPKKQVPLIMLGSMVVNAVGTIPMLFAFLFCNVKPDNLLAPIGGQPIIQLMYDAFDSEAMTIIGTLFYFFLSLFGTLGMVTTGSRVLWALGRDKAMPCSTWLSQIHKQRLVPINAVWVFSALSVVLAVFVIVSSTAFNALIGSGSLFFYLSYAVPIACNLFGARKTLPAMRYCNLGRAGPIINVLAVLWVAVMLVFLSFPLSIPVTATSMNYASVVVVGLTTLHGVNWLVHSRKHYSTKEFFNPEELESRDT